MGKERDIYERFLDGMMSSLDFRQETGKRWRKYVREYRKRNPTEKQKNFLEKK